MQDTRWNNPGHLPLSNGPLRIVTPGTPRWKLVEDGKQIDFFLPFPMHIVNAEPWAPLEFEFGEQKFKLSKPIPILNPERPADQTGEESADAYSCVLNVASRTVNVQPGDIWPEVERLLTWIRVKGRHFWIFQGQIGFAATYRSSVLAQERNLLSQQNVVAYGPNVIVRPLDQEIWESLGSELRNGTDVPIAENLFCDALASAVAGDKYKSFLELGVAAEVEISHLLASLAMREPLTDSKTAYLSKKGDRNSFKLKLTRWPQELGAQKAQNFQRAHLLKDWLKVMLELYELRNSVAHSGRLRPGVTPNVVSDYLFSTNSLFAYCREQRKRAGIETYEYPAERDPYEQLISYTEGTFSSVSNGQAIQLA